MLGGVGYSNCQAFSAQRKPSQNFAEFILQLIIASRLSDWRLSALGHLLLSTAGFIPAYNPAKTSPHLPQKTGLTAPFMRATLIATCEFCPRFARS